MQKSIVFVPVIFSSSLSFSGVVTFSKVIKRLNILMATCRCQFVVFAVRVFVRRRCMVCVTIINMILPNTCSACAYKNNGICYNYSHCFQP